MINELKITIKDKEYNLRLTAKACVELERSMGTNPVNIFTAMTGDELPKLSDLIAVFHAALQSTNHGITLDKAYDLYDAYCDEGGNIATFIELVVSIFRNAGFIPEVEDKSKN